MPVKVVEEGKEKRVFKHCWRAASKVKGIKGGEAVFVEEHFFLEGVLPYRNPGECGFRIEIAVGALAFTKGNVEIESRRRIVIHCLI